MSQVRFRHWAPRLSCLILLLVSLTPAPARAGTSDFTINVADIQGDFTVWVPDDLPRVHGLIYILPGSSGNTQHFPRQPYYQQAARSLGFGMVGMGVHGGRAVAYFLRWDKDDDALQRSLDAAAKATGHPELTNVPVGLIGHSAGCVGSAVIARSNPKRVIAIASGGNSMLPAFMTASMDHIPALFIGASKDTANAARAGRMQAMVSQWRTELNAQTAFAVDWGSPHSIEFNQAMPAALFWISEVTRLRCPAGEPSITPGNPVALTDIDTASGWLGETTTFDAADNMTPTSTSPFTNIALAANFKGDPKTASWLPTEDTAFVYRALTSLDSIEAVERRLALPSVKGEQGNQPFQGELKFIDLVFNARGNHTSAEVNTPVTVQIDPRQFVAANDRDNRISQMVLYDGSKEIGRANAPGTGSVWSFSFKPDRTGAHGLVVIATDANGRQTSSFTTLFVQGPGTTPQQR